MAHFNVGFEDSLEGSGRPVEKDPTGISAKTPGAKLDAGKAPVFQGLLDYFPRACLKVAELSAKGASKYSWKGWEKVDDGVNRYANAGARHIVKEAIEGPYDSDPHMQGVLHKTQKAWNSMAELELFLRGLEPQQQSAGQLIPARFREQPEGSNP